MTTPEELLIAADKVRLAAAAFTAAEEQSEIAYEAYKAATEASMAAREAWHQAESNLAMLAAGGHWDPRTGKFVAP